MKKLIAGVLTAVVLSAAACTADQSGAGGASDASMRVTLIAKGTDDHWALVKEGAFQAGKELGVTVTFNAPDTESEGDRQLNMVQSAVNDKPDGIGIAPQDGIQDGAPALLDQAKSNEIPVVAFDTAIKGSDVPAATIASDNSGIGAQLAEEVAGLIGSRGKVAMVTNGMVGTAAERRDGFIDWMKANAPEIQIVDVQNGEADPAKSRDKAQGILQAHPDLSALVGTSNYSTIAIADEVAAKGAKVIVAGVDAAPDVVTQIKEGKIAGVVAQNPVEIGRQTVETLVHLHKGEAPAEKTIVTKSLWVTPGNIDDPEMKSALGLN